MKESQIIISFLGDVALNGRYTGMDSPQNPFARVSDKLKGTDYVVGNFEAVLDGIDGYNQKKIPYLHTNEWGASKVKGLSVNLLSLAHNHVYDTFDSGFANTTKFLNEAGILYTGAELNEMPSAKICRVKDTTIAFLNYCHPDTNFCRPDTTAIHLSVYNKQKILSDISNYKSLADFVILLLHWGGKTDYGFFPHEEQIAEAKLFIDSGADCIIGHHAHCIQPLETYKGKPIYYCLGNFCFDDIVSHGKTFPVRGSGKLGLVAKIKINPVTKKITTYTLGVKNRNLEIYPSFRVRLYLALINFLFPFYKMSDTFRKLYKLLYLKKIDPFLYYLKVSNRSVIDVLYKGIAKRLINKLS